jgi:NAD(P)-dependent dehydrogenase (short-subunit alcohol dehydrogenase family)
MAGCFVVTGGARGVGRAVAERLLQDGGAVVLVDADERAMSWARGHPAAARIQTLAGDASDDAVAARAAGMAEDVGGLTGWVNNAAVFRDAALDAVPTGETLSLIGANLRPAVAGCRAAIGQFLASGTQGAIVNVSSHQAQRPVRGALPYATAKAAVEGLTRSLAVDYGRYGIRVNAVALGTIVTERYQALLAGQGPAEAAQTEAAIATVHPLGRPGQAEEAAAAIAFLLSGDASFVNGAILPVDGGRSALGQDPEQT